MTNENQESTPVEDEQETLENRVVTFSINDAAIAEKAEEYKDVDATKDLVVAKAAKKDLTKMRTTLGEAHKEAKADALAYGRRCDAEKNRLLVLIGEIEDPITEQLDEIKNAEKIVEEARVQKIMDGIEQIQAFALDRYDLTFDQLNERLDTLLALKVDPDFFEDHTEDAENAKEVSESKLRIAIMNEETRLKEAAEKEELARKNKELQAELDKSRKANEERDQKRREYDAEQDRLIREQDDARQKALDDQQAEIDRQTKEREDAVRAEGEALFEANEKQKAQELRDLQAPDVDKLSKYADAVDHLIGLKPVMGSTTGNAVILQAVSVMIEVVYDIRKSTEEMK